MYPYNAYQLSMAFICQGIEHQRNVIMEINNDSRIEIISDMLRSADEFLEISHNNKTFIPNFVNMAFACELYLKTILYCRAGKYPPTHNLEALYMTVVNNIDEKEFLAIIGDKINASFSFDYPKDDLLKVKDDLLLMFNEHKCLFKEWRYIFEGKIPKPYIANMTLKSFALVTCYADCGHDEWLIQ